MTRNLAHPTIFLVIVFGFFSAGGVPCLAEEDLHTSPLFFDQMFPYSLTTVESGEPIVKSGEKKLPAPVSPGMTVPVGATVEAPALTSVVLRLACGSTMRLAPEARIRLENHGISLEKGAVLIRHVVSYFPLKLTGASTFLISRDSLIEADRVDDKVFARVQVGTVRHPGLPKPVLAGESIEASQRAASLLASPRPARSWDRQPAQPAGPAVQQIEPTAPPAELFPDEADSDLNPTPVSQPLFPGATPEDEDGAPPTPAPPEQGSGIDKVLGF